MYTKTETNNATNLDPAPIRILLAESDPAEIAGIRSNIDLNFQGGIQIVNNYYDLMKKVAETAQQVLILGMIDNSNPLGICKECREIWEQLPIVLISKQSVVDSFRELARTWGATDIITNDAVKLNQLLQSFVQTTPQQPDHQPQPRSQSTISGEEILTGLREIAEIGSNYFGPLAQGNYWRKAHDHIVDEFPFVQNWSADHFGKIGCHDSMLVAELTDAEIYSLRIWVSTFIEECERIIVDFDVVLNNSDLSPLAKDLLAKS